MPYQEIVPGTRATSDYMNEYVVRQVVPVFTTTSQRDSQITSPIEGMECAVTGTKRRYMYDGSAWVIIGNYTAAGRVGCNLRRNAAQTINGGAQNTITWDTEDQDTDGFIAVSATTVTIPTGLGGLYDVSCRMTASGAASPGIIYMSLNGEYYAAAWPTGALYCSVSAAGVPLAAGNVIGVDVYNNSGSNRDYTGRLTVYRRSA